MNLEVTGRPRRVGLQHDDPPGATRGSVSRRAGRSSSRRRDDRARAPFAREVALPVRGPPAGPELAVLSPDGSGAGRLPDPESPKAAEPSRRPPPPPAEVKTAEELYLAGLRLEQFHSPHFDPEPYYSEALRRDPGDARANTSLGLLPLRRGWSEEAEKRFPPQSTRDREPHPPEDGEPPTPSASPSWPWEAGGRPRGARGRRPGSGVHRGRRAEQARLESARGNPSRALELLDRARDADPRGTPALVLSAALLRHGGRAARVFARASAALVVDPLDPLAARERRLAREAGARPAADAAADAAEAAALPALDEDAYALEAAHEVRARLSPGRRYRGARRPPAAARGEGGPHGGVHPRRAPRAQGRRGASGHLVPPWPRAPARLLLPLPPRGDRRPRARDGARPAGPPRALLPGQPPFRPPARAGHRGTERSLSLDPDFARVHRNLAFAYARARGALAQAAASQQKAVAIESASRAGTTSPTSTWPGRRLPSRRASRVSPRAPRRWRAGRSPPAVPGVQVLLGRDDDAVDTLSGTRFHVWEGERGIHSVYVAARLERGRRLLAKGDAAAALDEFRATVDVPANIEVGQGAGAHLAATHHHVGLALEKLAARTRPRPPSGSPRVCPRWSPRATTGSAGRCRSSAAAWRPAATSSGSRRPGRGGDPARPLEVRMEAREGRSADLHGRPSASSASAGRPRPAPPSPWPSTPTPTTSAPSSFAARSRPPAAPRPGRKGHELDRGSRRHARGRPRRGPRRIEASSSRS